MRVKARPLHKGNCNREPVGENCSTEVEGSMLMRVVEENDRLNIIGDPQKVINNRV